MTVAPDDTFESEDGVAHIARFGPIFACIFYKGLSAATLDAVREWQGPIMPAEPIYSFSMSFAADRLAPDVAAAADRLLLQFRDQTAGSATVLRVFGFEGSAARAMLGTIHLVTRAAYPRKVFSNVADGTAWLTKLRGECPHVAAADVWLTRFEHADNRRRAATGEPQGSDNEFR